MCRNVLLVTLLGLGCWLVPSPPSQADEPKRSIADLVADLKKGDKEQLRAIQELEALGDKAAEAVTALVELLQSKNEDVRLQATMALGKIGRPAVAPLSKALAAKDADVRFYAVWGLAFIGPPAKSATPGRRRQCDHGCPGRAGPDPR
jgi:HEAT repeat protein